MTIRSPCAALAAACLCLPAFAQTGTEIRATIGAGACGGSVGCSQSVDLRDDQALPGSSEGRMLANTLADGAYADASGLATLGHLHADAEKHRASNSSLGGRITVGDAQSSAQTLFIGDVLPGASNPAIGDANCTLTLVVNGSHTAVWTTRTRT